MAAVVMVAVMEAEVMVVEELEVGTAAAVLAAVELEVEKAVVTEAAPMVVAVRAAATEAAASAGVTAARRLPRPRST